MRLAHFDLLALFLLGETDGDAKATPLEGVKGNVQVIHCKDLGVFPWAHALYFFDFLGLYIFNPDP
jgi:hypothetical protein